MDKNIFISYRRDTGSMLARLVYDRITIQKRWHVFLDVEELAAGDFRRAIQEKMRSCDIFILILSKNSLDRCSDLQDNVRLEIETAREENLAFIPVMTEDFEWPQKMPEGLEYVKDCNAVPYIQVYSQSFFERLYEFIKDVRKKNNAAARHEAAAAMQEKVKGAAETRQALIKKAESARRDKSRSSGAGSGDKKKTALLLSGILGIIAVLAIVFGVRTVCGPAETKTAIGQHSETGAEKDLQKDAASSSGEPLDRFRTITADHYDMLEESYVIGGKDWKGANRLSLQKRDGDAYCEYALEKKYSSLTLDYLPCGKKFSGNGNASLTFIDADTGRILETVSSIRKNTAVSSLTVDVEGVSTLRILGKLLEGEWAQLLYTNAYLTE